MDLYTEITRLIQTTSDNQGCTKQAALRDLLTDTRHVANNLGLDFDQAVNASEIVQIEENNEDIIPQD